MTTEEKLEIIEAVIYELSEFKDKYGNVPEDFSIHESKLQNLLEAIEQEQPEPLDPHTCELCVGDVVNAEFGIFFWENLVVVNPKDKDGKVVLYYPKDGYTKSFFRDKLTLKSNQRAGVQIGEV